MSIETRMVISAGNGMLHFRVGAVNQDPDTFVPAGCVLLRVVDGPHEEHRLWQRAFAEGFSHGMRDEWRADPARRGGKGDE